ncbi:DUF883 family protein [Marinicauda algicola]|uniref:DUF883 family protein n=1 Tax=Marinicauda algicola TaxID=2029849 RepID=A0A4S2GXR3_9PROT|nr:DUF883 family protein [Marinicauda algicola]TGY87651.1 DUF883 family protein [Marinicauda algicola]
MATRQTASNDVEISAVKDDIAALRKDVDKLVGDLSKIAEQETEKGIKRTRKAASQAQDEIESYGSDVRDYIRDNPLSACGAALGVGFIAALLMRK